MKNRTELTTLKRKRKTGNKKSGAVAGLLCHLLWLFVGIICFVQKAVLEPGEQVVS
ncbi:hypothetical protein J2S07_000370 [Robertmurraya andreesenii]|uniref:Uncharacterized protein n=1 Tax=Anoxybacillus andreesenii TaxID=1325932 RepID=A0ABT9UZF6_9BACL|nr:hypothetical protein [Robertmurraya andreesenii]